MERAAFDGECGHLGGGDLDALGIAVAIAASRSSGLPTTLGSIFSVPDFTFGLSHSMEVSMAPGKTKLTRMPFALPSRETDRVSETTAAFAAA